MGEQTVKKHKFKKWRKPGIRMQVMLGFVLFTAVIVTLLWTFQITLLNTFYKAIKVNEVRSVANRVVAMLDESASASDYFEVTRSTTYFYPHFQQRRLKCVVFPGGARRRAGAL